LFFILAVVCLVGGGSVAADTMQLDKGEPPYLSPYAYYMSVGPRRPADPDTSEDTGLFFMRPESQNLRVTLSNCERSWLMTISEIVTRRADTREVIAEYHLPLWEIRSSGSTRRRLHGSRRGIPLLSSTKGTQSMR
jgi:hypothetical protein